MARATLTEAFSKSFSVLFPATLPPIHIYVLYKYWGRYSRLVDKRYCTCSCWDTVYKGSYESGIASYKHVYFNATFNTTKIWLTTVVAIILLYESCKYEIRLLFERRVRCLMLLLFLTSLFPHYYTWWVYFNYWNDDFYTQWNHQLFFTITELLSTFLVVYLSDAKRPVSPKAVLVISAIASVHILAGGWDQFVANVVLGEGYAHQVVRDVCFMIPDVLHLILPLVQLLRSQRSEILFWRKHLLFVTALTTVGFCVSYIL